LEEVLDDLRKLVLKFKQNSKLNLDDSVSVKERMGCLLEDPEFWIRGYGLLLSLPPEPACHAFLEGWKRWGETRGGSLIDGLLDFENIDTVQGHNRLIYLTRLFIPVSDKIAIRMLRKLGEILTEGGTQKPSQKTMKVFRDNLMKDRDLLKLSLGKHEMTPDQIRNISTLVMFGLIDESTDVSPEAGYLNSFLEWIAECHCRPVLSEKTMTMIERGTRRWPEDVQRSCFSLGLIKTVVYKPDTGTSDTSKSIQASSSVTGTSRIGGVRPESIPEKFDAMQYLSRLGVYIRELEYQRSDLADNRQAYQREYNHRIALEKQLTVLQEEIEAERGRGEYLQRRLDVADTELVRLKEQIESKEREHERGKRDMLNMVERGPEIAVMQVKNRLARLLRTDFRDYIQIEDEPMTVELGENLRAQLRGIFKILEDEDIRMSGGEGY
jgi:hypothetical protein